MTFSRQPKYQVLEKLSETLVLIRHPQYGTQMWSKAGTRKPFDCRICSQPVGVEAYRPITTGLNRQHRICTGCVEGVTKLE